MGRPMYSTAMQRAGERVDWVDYAKGFCIVFVVMMHSTLGVEHAARPGGLAAHRRRLRQAVPHAGLLPDLRPVPGAVIDRDWRTYLDRKVVHFVYFYLLWTAIQFAVQGAGVRARARRRSASRWLYLEVVLGAVRHALVHLSAADLLRRHQAGAQPARPAARRSGSPPPRSKSRRSNRLDRDRRVRQPLRLFLHRLSARAAHLRAGGARRRRSPRRRSPGWRVWGAGQRPPRVQRATPSCRSSRSRSGLPARRRWSRSRR